MTTRAPARPIKTPRGCAIAAKIALALAVCAACGPCEASGAVTTTYHLDGDVPPTSYDFFSVPFDVPAGTAEVRVQHMHTQDADNILDWGLNDARGNPEGFRGWGGGNLEPAIVGANATSRSYLLGPMTAGTWNVIVGKPRIVAPPGRYNITVELLDAPSLPPQPQRRPYKPAEALHVPAGGGGAWYAGDFHMHSRESGDAFTSATLDEMASFGHGRGLDFIHISDHNTVSAGDFIGDAQPRHPDTLILPGVEFTTYYGHAGAIGTTKYVDHKIGWPGVTVRAAADAVHAQGGLFSINHFDMYEGSAFDVRNRCVGCAWEMDGDLPSTQVDAIEIAVQGWSGLGWVFSPQAIEHWDHLCAMGHTQIAPIGGSDDHHGGANETQVGPWRAGSPIGNPTTMVLAANLSHAAVIDGVRNGHTVVRMYGPTDPMVVLTARDAVAAGRGATAAVAQAGDYLCPAPRARAALRGPTAASVTLDVSVTFPTGARDAGEGNSNFTLVLVRNNADTYSVPVPGVAPLSYNVTVPAPTAGTDRWRAEVRSGSWLGEAVQVRRVITNHLYVPAATSAPAACSGASGSAVSAHAVHAADRM